MDPLWVAILTAIGVSLLVLGSLIRRRSFDRMEKRRQELLRRHGQFLQAGARSIRAARTRVAGALVSALTLLLLASLPAAADEAPRGRCVRDALETWFCPSDPKGVAVLDNLGAAVCAAGSCVEVEDAWQCSAVSGGNAERTPEGPVCEGGCRSPRSADCKRM
jgi:hypothetical protein